MDHGTPDPVIRKRRLEARPKKDCSLGDVIGPGGLEPGAPQRLLNWRLDWREYFRRFCEKHGGNPIEIGGKLVLPDGWSYSCTSYKGPEWPPPDDPFKLRALLAAYWTERAGIVRDELKHLRLTRKGMIEMMTSHDAPLIKSTKRYERDGEVSRLVIDREELTLDAVDLRIKWLAEDLLESESKVLEYKT